MKSVRLIGGPTRDPSTPQPDNVPPRDVTDRFVSRSDNGLAERPAGGRSRAKSLPADVQRLAWAAEQLGVGLSTAYRLAESGEMPGAFKVGAQWRISVPRFWREVHGRSPEGGGSSPSIT
jgi:excisionase family DNA binding protein